MQRGGGKEGFCTHCAANGEEAWALLEQEHIDLIVTDLMMPVMDGYEFVQTVSYEFKTPLAAIEGYAHLLEGENLSPKAREYLRKIAESSRQLSRLTGNILRLFPAGKAGNSFGQGVFFSG